MSLLGRLHTIYQSITAVNQGNQYVALEPIRRFLGWGHMVASPHGVVLTSLAARQVTHDEKTLSKTFYNRICRLVEADIDELHEIMGRDYFFEAVVGDERGETLNEFKYITHICAALHLNDFWRVWDETEALSVLILPEPQAFNQILALDVNDGVMAERAKKHFEAQKEACARIKACIEKRQALLNLEGIHDLAVLPPMLVEARPQKLLLARLGLYSLPDLLALLKSRETIGGSASSSRTLISGLKLLDVQENRLTKLPDVFAVLVSFEKLLASKNRLTEFPFTLSQHIYVSEIDLSENQIENLPEDFGYMENLKDLNLKGNKLKRIPKSIGDLKSLKRLILANNPLNELSTNFAKTPLEYLDVSGTEIVQFPDGLLHRKGIQIVRDEDTRAASRLGEDDDDEQIAQ